MATNYNPGIADLCNNITVENINDPEIVKTYAKKHKIDFSIIGPENPLANGIADALSDIGAIYIEINNLNLAKKYLHKSLEINSDILRSFAIFSAQTTAYCEPTISEIKPAIR